MSGIDHNGDGYMDMLPDETVVHLKKLHDVSEKLRGAWMDARKTIEKEMRIGNGPMGQAFMANYKPKAEAVGSAVYDVYTAYRNAANWGYEAVQIYQGADAEATKEFPRS